ncbi:MAG: ABC transporter substrate-binding protein [Thaumarchaeota archaeon]|nr:ABC transporter substrate-binding protein [Candidatus Calditenuaceae archaeon]MDW8186698.1 ABC transporter substrate-binding protein [Nitrososphaerota archaeon]
MNRRILVVGVAAVIVAAIAIVFVLPTLLAPRLGVETVKIGALNPLTGPFATWGKKHLAGAQMAVKEINDRGGILGARVELVVYDDKNDAKEAVAAFQRLVDVDKVVAVTGPVSSGIAAALTPEANKARVTLLLHMAGSHTLLTLTNRYVFRTCLPAAPMNAQPVAEFIRQQNLRNVANVIASYEWGFAVRDASDRLIKTISGINYQMEEAPQRETDFTSYLRRIQPLNPDVVLTLGHPPGGPTIVKQALEIGLRPRFFVGSYTPVDNWLAALGEDGLINSGLLEFSCINFDAPEYRQIAERFYRTNNMFFDIHAATGYLNVLLIANAIERTQSVDPVKVADYIRTSRFDHPLLAWPLSYTEWGEFKEARIILYKFERGDPGSINPGAKWVPRVVFRSSPVEPYRPAQ